MSKKMSGLYLRTHSHATIIAPRLCSSIVNRGYLCRHQWAVRRKQHPNQTASTTFTHREASSLYRERMYSNFSVTCGCDSSSIPNRFWTMTKPQPTWYVHHNANAS